MHLQPGDLVYYHQWNALKREEKKFKLGIVLEYYPACKTTYARAKVALMSGKIDTLYVGNLELLRKA